MALQIITFVGNPKKFIPEAQIQSKPAVHPPVILKEVAAFMEIIIPNSGSPRRKKGAQIAEIRLDHSVNTAQRVVVKLVEDATLRGRKILRASGGRDGIPVPGASDAVGYTPVLVAPPPEPA